MYVIRGKEPFVMTLNDLEGHFWCLQAFWIKYFVNSVQLLENTSHIAYTYRYKRLQRASCSCDTTILLLPWSTGSIPFDMQLLEKSLHIAHCHRQLSLYKVKIIALCRSLANVFCSRSCLTGITCQSLCLFGISDFRVLRFNSLLCMLFLCVI